MEKRALIEPGHPDLSVRRQCRLLKLSRSSYYRTPAPETEENLGLMRLIDREYTCHPFLDSRGMRDYLYRLGHRVNRKRVGRLMRIMGLASVVLQKKTSVPAPGHKVYPYLLRGLNINRPGQVWASDITYVSLARRLPACLKITASGSAWTGKGRATDNIMVERLWRTVKYIVVNEIGSTLIQRKSGLDNGVH